MAQAPCQIGWLSLDRQDNDPTWFRRYLIAAIQTAHAHLGENAQRLIRTPQPPSVPAILTPLLNALTVLSDQLVLVLDDYHLISTQAIREGITFFLDHQPHNMHLVIPTRADPPLPTFRLRARRQVTELRSGDLRFTPDEAAICLNTMMGLNLGPEDVEALEPRTEGWIVGLQLAALSLPDFRSTSGGGPVDVAHWIRRLSHPGATSEVLQ